MHSVDGVQLTDSRDAVPIDHAVYRTAFALSSAASAATAVAQVIVLLSRRVREETDGARSVMPLHNRIRHVLLFQRGR